jgi:hypothetical protein
MRKRASNKNFLALQVHVNTRAHPSEGGRRLPQRPAPQTKRHLPAHLRRRRLYDTALVVQRVGDGGAEEGVSSESAAMYAGGRQ